MPRLAVLLMSTLIALTIGPGAEGDNITSHEPQQDTPSYAKWGRLAMEKTRSRYPDADIVDYLHRGRETQGSRTIEKFTLRLREDERAFGVLITIVFETETEKIHKITFEETA